MYYHARLMLLDVSCSACITVTLALADLFRETLVCSMKACSHLLLECMSSLIFRSAFGNVYRQGTLCFGSGVALTGSSYDIDGHFG